MAQAPASVPRATTAAYGKWLADQEFSLDADGNHAWILNEYNNYLVEGITQDSEDKCVSYTEMEQAMQLMQHAPRLLRFVLRGLELLDNATLNDSTKVEHLQLLLSEVAGNCLRGQGDPLDVARAVQERHVSRE